MAEEIRRSRKLIGSPQGLQFDLDLDCPDQDGLAWGQGMVLLEGEPFWFAEGQAGEEIPSWGQVQNALEEAGNFLARAVSGSSNARADYALDLWRQRDKALAEQELYITTGLAQDDRNRFQDVDWHSEEIRVAARMSSKTVLFADQQEFLKLIAGAPRKETPELDSLFSAIQAEFQETGPPHEQGYWAAGRVRSALGLAVHDYAHPEKYLKQWGVLIQKISRQECPVEAVSAWGEKHGPVIIVNQGSGSRAGHEFGERATLAHEMAHLILDRDRALPAAEVLGGRTPEYPEKRARAFAAEFLLPRELAKDAVRRHASLEEAARYLQKTYLISTEMLAWQINNSGARMTLDQEELTLWSNGKQGVQRFLQQR